MVFRITTLTITIVSTRTPSMMTLNRDRRNTPLSIMILSTLTIRIMTLSIWTLRIMILLRIILLSMTKLSIMKLSIIVTRSARCRH